MNKISKLITTVSLMVVMTFVAIFARLYSAIVAFNQGQMPKDHFIYILQTRGLGALIAIFLITLVGGFLIVLLAKGIAFFRKTNPLGFFEKFWPYGLCFAIVIVGSITGAVARDVNTILDIQISKSLDPKPEPLATEDNPLSQFVMNFLGDSPSPEKILDEVDTLLANVMEGKAITPQTLQDVRDQIQQRVVTYKNEVDARASFFKIKGNKTHISDELEKFLQSNKETFTISDDEKDEAIDAIYNIVQQGLQSKAYKLQARSFDLLAKIGMDLTALLLKEQGQVSYDESSSSWMFSSDEAVQEFNDIISHTQEIAKLNEQIDVENEALSQP